MQTSMLVEPSSIPQPNEGREGVGGRREGRGWGKERREGVGGRREGRGWGEGEKGGGGGKERREGVGVQPGTLTNVDVMQGATYSDLPL